MHRRMPEEHARDVAHELHALRSLRQRREHEEELVGRRFGLERAERLVHVVIRCPDGIEPERLGRLRDVHERRDVRPGMRRLSAADPDGDLHQTRSLRRASTRAVPNETPSATIA
jgi:hypothetical protein